MLDNTIKISPEAKQNSKEIIEVNRDTVNYLKQQASNSPRGRYRLCLHRSNDHPINEMVIIGNQTTYFRPHRHPKGRDESYYIIEGRMVVFIFDDNGNVVRMLDMGEYQSGLTVLYRLCSNLWHLPVSLTERVVYHEVLTGPFKKEDTVEYASWSPHESDANSVLLFMKELMKTYHQSNRSISK
jgi:glucose-6-phosphate isomerase